MNNFSAHNLTTTGFSMDEQMEDLLVQYADGTLSASDHARFEALLRENPAFAEEVRAITSFDDLISDAHLETRWADRVDTAFLSEMQQQFAQAVTLGTAVATAGAAASTTAASAGMGTSVSAAASTSVGTTITSGIAGTSTGISAGAITSFLTGTLIGKTLLVAGVCSAIGYGAWKYTPTTTIDPAPATDRLSAPSEQMQRETVQNKPNSAADATAAKASSNAAPTSTDAATDALAKGQGVNMQQQSAASGSETASSLASVQDNKQDNKTKANANIESSAAQELRSKIEQLAVQLHLKEQSGDKAGAAFDLKKLGMLERTAGKYAESNEFFDKALKNAQALKLRELEGEIRAEIALLYREQGSTEKALTSLREAVKILTDEGSARATRWAKELERWEKP
ncbi:MAG: tetratricopeptide repeat protein [Candidatus Kapabacteria bacterium]|nr:tetratricopeptide repeat protein [Candidatus Kapabacteria bacterium]